MTIKIRHPLIVTTKAQSFSLVSGRRALLSSFHRSVLPFLGMSEAILESVGRVVVNLVIRSASGRRLPMFVEPALLVAASSSITEVAFSEWMSSGMRLGASVVVRADVMDGEERRPPRRADDIGRDWSGAPLGRRR